MTERVKFEAESKKVLQRLQKQIGLTAKKPVTKK